MSARETPCMCRVAMTSNQSLEWAFTSWPHFAQKAIIASCGQQVPASEFQR